MDKLKIVKVSDLVVPPEPKPVDGKVYCDMFCRRLSGWFKRGAKKEFRSYLPAEHHAMFLDKHQNALTVSGYSVAADGDFLKISH